MEMFARQAQGRGMRRDAMSCRRFTLMPCKCQFHRLLNVGAFLSNEVADYGKCLFPVSYYRIVVDCWKKLESIMFSLQ